MNWDAISAISSAVQSLVVIVAAALALWQLRESLVARQTTGFLRLLDELELAGARQMRRFVSMYSTEIRELARNNEVDRLDHFLKKRTRSSGHPLSLTIIQDYFSSMEHIAMLCLNGMLPDRLEKTYLTVTVVKTWPNIQPVVSMLRRDLGAPYLQHLEALYGLCASGAIYKQGYGRARKREARRLLENSKITTLGRG